ncbi:MAG TPA: response regulator [Pseudomonadales bacterium]|nr:response regulator [Pseudomonadales bacterium]
MMQDNTLLLVEDNADDEALAMRAFRNSEHVSKVVVVRDGAEALDYLFGTGQYSGRDTGDQPRLILLDMKLPKLNGLDVLRRIRQDERTRYHPVVLMTSSRQETDIIAGYSLGANSYIQKPVNFDEFVESMRDLGRYWMQINRTPNLAINNRN